MGFGDINQSLRVTKQVIENFTVHVSQAPKEVTKQEASTLVKTIKTTFEQLPSSMQRTHVSTKVNQTLVKDVQASLKNLFIFLQNNPAVNPQITKMVSSLVGVMFKQTIEAFKRDVEKQRRSPKAPGNLMKVVKVEKGGLNKGR